MAEAGSSPLIFPLPFSLEVSHKPFVGAVSLNSKERSFFISEDKGTLTPTGLALPPGTSCSWTFRISPLLSSHHHT